MRNVLQTQINNIGVDAGNSDHEVEQDRCGHQVLADRLNEIDLQMTDKVDYIKFDKNESIIKFYSGDKIISSIDVTESVNNDVIQNYIDSLVSDGEIKGVTLGEDSISIENI